MPSTKPRPVVSSSVSTRPPTSMWSSARLPSTAEKLYDNFAALMDAISKARPAGAKGLYIKHITVTTTMGPGIKVDPNAAL